MIRKTICQECNTPNTPGGKFCSNCGARLPKSTSILCPRCQTPNPSSNFYCDSCGSRLVQEEIPLPEQPAPEEDLPTSAKMFSLPSRKPGDTGELNAENVMDWLMSGQGDASDTNAKPQTDTGKLPRLSDLTPEQRGKTDDLPAWLVDSDSQEFLIEAPEDITTEHFLNMIKQIDEEERKKLTGMLSDPALTGKGGKLPDWLQEFVQSAEETGQKPPPKATPPSKPQAGKRGTSSQPGADAEDLDWLSELGPLNTDMLAHPVEQPQIRPPQGAANNDLPDWLGEMEPPNTEMLARPSFAADELSVEAILSGEGPTEGIPDWLAATGAPDTDRLSHPVTAAKFDEEESEEDYPEWLVKPPDTSELALPAAPKQVESAVAADSLAKKSVTDWLAGFEDDDEDAGEVAEVAEEEDDDEFDNIFAETAVTPIEETKTRKTLTDWLGELSSRDAAEPSDAEAAEEPEPAAGTLPDWLGSSEPETPTEDETSLSFGMTGPLPDWLDELEPTDAKPASAEETLVAGMLDDLLGPALPQETFLDEALEDEAEALTTAASFSEFPPDAQPLNVNEEPDWLSELAAFDPNAAADEFVAEPAPTAANETTAVEESLFADSLSDSTWRDSTWRDSTWRDSTWRDSTWRDVPDERETAVSTLDDIPLGNAGDEEWADLDEILGDASTEKEEFVDWLDEFADTSDASLMLDSSFDADDESTQEKPLISTGELPEWIASLRPEDTSQLDSLLPSALPTAEDNLYAIAADELGDADLPEWLSDTAVTTPEKPVTTLVGAELPVWIDTESDLGEPSSELASILADLPTAPPPEDLLQKAEIPQWIQDLKPAELTGKPTAAPDFKLETTGPLAGMPGVVKVEPIVAMPRAIIPADQFTITKEQQQQARLLRQLVQEEHQSTARAYGAGTTASKNGLRLLLAVVLFAAVIFALLGPDLLAGKPPSSLSAAGDGVHTAVTAAAGKPVLIAFEYTPAMSGELDVAARLLLSQLQDNGSQIITVSQSAGGTAVAETLTQSLENPPIHIGMLVGEAIGLRQLGNCLGSQRTTCVTLQGRSLNANTQAALQDLGLIIVLTGERDSLVNWLEQIDPNTDIPIIAGVTQSLGPVAAPYYASGQLQGMLDGLPDTIALANRYGSSADLTQAEAQLSAQSLIQLAAALLLIIGALALAANRKKSSTQGQ
ncbi:MAG: zinc ribbon domain-containing protein [Chloroflexi bacterium]|nr:zinc ribbon domain-containing protein [Chloroflexota bacterium]MBP7045108.1 zinc ribbon domain-containing protein [Chloroflexota bacterium]